jgi:hypothetical protein
MLYLPDQWLTVLLKKFPYRITSVFIIHHCKELDIVVGRNVHLTGIVKVVPLLIVVAMSSPKSFTP